jgi:hypothetical protein
MIDRKPKRLATHDKLDLCGPKAHLNPGEEVSCQ